MSTEARVLELRVATAAIVAIAACASPRASTTAAVTVPPTPAEVPAAETAAALEMRDPPTLDIPYEKFVLDNGLTLIVHEDRKAPIVAVNVWYHVGSKNEKPGRTGFAHLFEHLMFNGTENYNDDYFIPLQKVGATDLNGTTNPDRTNYFQNVPTPALDLVLFMESDRMGHLLGAIDRARLDEQRGVVQNEKRQGENQPYGMTRTLLAENTYPARHPYSWTTIGSMEDLDAATLEDVRDWFRTYYGPNNAVIVIAGDIDPATARAKVEKYFGAIPPGPPIAKQERWIAKMEGAHRTVMQDRVPQARIYMVWNVPEWGTAESDYLNLVTDVLAAGKNSRLYKRLVYDDQIATDVSAYIWQREIGGQVYIQATARPGEDLAKVERALEEELTRFLTSGPTPEELRRVKTQFHAAFIRGVERIGGFGGKSDNLATNQVYAGDPSFYKVTLDRVGRATAAELRQVANAWLSDGVYVLEVHPFPELKTIATNVDRSSLPDVAAPRAPDFPELETATLSNGLKVILARRDAVPLINFNLLVDAGYAADQLATPGTANLAMSMLDEGTGTRSALEISADLAMLGAQLGAGANLDMSSVFLSSLEARLDSSLAIFADVVLDPSFPQADFERLKQQQLAAIEREKVSPVSMALRVMPALLYGLEHAYGNPMTGSGTRESVSALTREELVEFHRRWFKPNNATLIVVGATTLDEIIPKLERAFRGWQAGEVPAKNVGEVAHKEKSEVYLIDRPGSQQSIIFAGHIAPSRRHPREIAIGALNTVLGGNFTSRINMNLREDKHWSYGARTLLFDARGQRPFIVYAPVQTDKTKESLQEVARELRSIIRDRPVTAEELAKVQATMTLALPGQWETIGAVESSIAELVRYDLPHDYFDNYADAVRALRLADLRSVAKEVVYPDRIVWVVVGDLEKIEEGVRALELGPVRRIDADGNPVTISAGSVDTP